MFGPGTFEMIRLNGFTRSSSRSRADSRHAWLARTGAANWLTSASRLAGIAPCCSFAARMASCAARRRFRGSDRWVGSTENIIETRLPCVPFWSSVRTETGTAETSGVAGNAS